MFNEQQEIEQKLKCMANQAQQQTCDSGALGSAQCPPAMPSLRERLRSQRYHAQVEARLSDQLQELEYLLDKHPEVARIIELLEIVRM